MRPPCHLLTPALLLALGSAAACGVGELTGHSPGGDPRGGGVDAGTDDTDPEPEPDPEDYALLVEPSSAELALGTETVFAVTLTSDNFAGPVALSADGAPDSWEVTFDPAQVSLPLDGSAESTVTVHIPTDGDAGSASLSIIGSASPGEHQAVTSVNVANVLDIPIADGTGGGQHGYLTNVVIKLGATVRFVNRDTGAAHQIHAPGDYAAVGFLHQEDEMDEAPSPDSEGGSYAITITEPGSYDYYCHKHEAGSGVGTIGVAAAE